jgi:hypothetical protein
VAAEDGIMAVDLVPAVTAYVRAVDTGLPMKEV